jgi:hypothetical protein
MKKGQTKEGIEGSELLLSMSTGLEDSTNMVQDNFMKNRQDNAGYLLMNY